MFLLVAYVGATAYLVYRDDLLGAAVSRQVKMQYAYEERIAALRAELDRLTSRHAVQTEGVEQQLATLLEQQATDRAAPVGARRLVDKARAAGLGVADGEPRVPRARPDARRRMPPAGDATAPLGYAAGPPDATADVISRTLLNRSASGAKRDASATAMSAPILAHVGSSLDRMRRPRSQTRSTR